ncbi:MAG: hypothetical protein WA148_03810 [Actinomycetota bacterium]
MSRVMSKKAVVKRLMEDWGGRFSAELGIDLELHHSEEIFKWFLASILFGTRIGQHVAMQTYREFVKRGVLTPDDILRTGWDGLVEILDAGGYVRYDYRTATKLLDIAEMLNKRCDGDLNQLHEEATEPRDLESKLMEFKGVGPVTANIFLRELRGIWEKADPLPGNLVITAARNLGFTTLEGRDDEERKNILLDLERVWEKEDLPYHFSDFEAALVKFGTEQRRKKHK